jgi:hypothetical protein
MRHLYVCLAALALAAPALAPSPAAAQNAGVRASAADSVSRVVPRRALEDADFAIVSRDGSNALLQTGGVIVLQLTDRGLARLDEEIPPPEAEQSTWGRLVGGIVRGALRVLLDNAIEYEIADLREVRHENGALRFVNRQGKPVFHQVNVNGQEFMESFSPEDAEAFARHVNRLLARRAAR